MDEKIAIGDRIAYREQMINALKEKIDKENEYKLSVIRNQKKALSKHRLYRVLVIILGVIEIDLISYLAPYYSTGDVGMFDAIAVVALSVLMPFVSLAFGFCLWKYIHYFRRRKKDLDTRDYKWRVYSEMLENADTSIEASLAEETKLIAELSVDRKQLDELIEKSMALTDESSEMKSISLNELKALPGVKQETEEEINPLFILGAHSGNVEIKQMDADSRGFFYQHMREYLPDTDSAKCMHYEKEYAACFLVAYNDGKPVGVAYGWPRKEIDPTDMSFTLQGIAITEKGQALGIGSRLLKEFERRVKALGYPEVSVGSAGGYVEHFYMKNGYTPVCYKYPSKYGDMVEEPLLGEDDYKRITRFKGGFVVFSKRLR